MPDRAARYELAAAGAFWKVECDECPVLPHTRALGQDAQPCASGFYCSKQGHVALNRCQHLGQGDDMGFRIVDGAFVAECLRENAGA